MFSIVVISNDSQPKVLKRALRSVQAQLYPAADVMVVEHGPSNRTEHVVAEYGRQLKRHVGYHWASGADAGTARNVGIERTRGDVVIFLDAHDELMPLTLEYYERGFQDSPQSAVCYGRCIRRAEDGSFIPSAATPLPSGHVLGALFRREIAIEPSAIACRRNVFQQGMRFPSCGDGLEPVEFLLQLGGRAHFQGVGEDVIIVDDAHRTRTPAQQSARCEIMTRQARCLFRKLDDETIAQCLAEYEYEAAVHWWTAGNGWHASRHLRRAICLRPRNVRYWLLLGWIRSHGHRYLLTDYSRQQDQAA